MEEEAKEGKKPAPRKGEGRGGSPLKNAARVAMATRKTTSGFPGRLHPTDSLLLLLSIHFTIWCHFQLINLPVFYKQHFCK